MSKKIKKGFTLIELLVVIVIIGLVMALVLPSVIKSINTGKGVYTEQLKEQLVLSAQDYYSSNDEELPRGQIINGDEIKTIAQVYVSQLESGNYLSNDVKDPDGGSCEKSFILVTNEDNEFEYKVCLKCENEEYNDDDIYCQQLQTLEKDYQSPTCDISYGDYIPGTWSEGPVTATFTATPDPLNDDIVKITGFENRGIDPNESHSTSGFGTQTYQQTFSETTLLDFWVYDNNGKTGQCIGNASINPNQIKVDNIAPYCTVTLKKEDNTSYTEGTWSNQNVVVSWNCFDDETGLSMPSTGSEILNSDGIQNYTVTATDKAGNSKSYTKTIKIDKTAPSTPSLTGGSNSWTAGSRTLVATSSDTHSGIAKYQFYYSGSWHDVLDGDVVFSATRNESVSARAVDNAGNISSNASATVRIDKEPPVVSSVTGGSSYWTSGSRTLTINATDSHSGIAKYQFYYSGSWHDAVTTSNSTLFGVSRYENVEGRAIDNVGNISNTDKYGIVKIDKTSPTCSVTSTNYGYSYIDHWPQSIAYVSPDVYYYSKYAKTVTINVSCSDTYSGLSTSSSFSKIATSIGSHTLSYSATDNVGHTYNGSKSVTVSAVYYKWSNPVQGSFSACTNVNVTKYCSRANNLGSTIFENRYSSEHHQCYNYTIKCSESS